MSNLAKIRKFGDANIYQFTVNDAFCAHFEAELNSKQISSGPGTCSQIFDLFAIKNCEKALGCFSVHFFAQWNETISLYILIYALNIGVLLPEIVHFKLFIVIVGSKISRKGVR